jgi:hypothetical protein
MTTTDSRERFEKWAKSAGFDVSPESDGNYKARDTYHAWIAWQAALSVQAPSVAAGELEALALAIERGGDAVRHMGDLGKMSAGTRSDVAASIRNLIKKAASHE